MGDTARANPTCTTVLSDTVLSDTLQIPPMYSQVATVPEAVAHYTNPIAIGYTNFRILWKVRF